MGRSSRWLILPYPLSSCPTLSPYITPSPLPPPPIVSPTLSLSRVVPLSFLILSIYVNPILTLTDNWVLRWVASPHGLGDGGNEGEGYLQLALIDFGKAKDLRLSNLPVKSDRAQSKLPVKSDRAQSILSVKFDPVQNTDTVVMFVGNVSGDPPHLVPIY